MSVNNGKESSVEKTDVLINPSSNCVIEKSDFCNLYIWTSFSEKRNHLVQSFLCERLISYEYIRHFKYHNWENQNIPLGSKITNEITSGYKGSKQLHVVWPSVKDINCPNFRSDLSVLLSLVCVSNLFLVIVYPVAERKSEKQFESSYEEFRLKIEPYLKSGNVKVISFGELNIPYIDDEVEGPKIRELYFKSENYLNKFGWLEGSFQVVCILKLFCYQIATGAIRRRVKVRKEGEVEKRCYLIYSL
jgi:hypothetical protein